MADEFKIRLSGDVSDVEEVFEKMLKTFEQQVKDSVGGVMTKEFENTYRRLQQFDKSIHTQKKGEAAENKIREISSGTSIQQVNRNYRTTLQDEGDRQDIVGGRLEKIHQQLLLLNQETRKTGLSNQQVLGAVATTLALREIAGVAAGYYDARAGLRGDTVGITTGANAVSSGTAGIGAATALMAFGMGNPMAASLGALTAGITFIAEHFGQASQRDLGYTDRVYSASGSLGRYDNSFQDLLHYDSSYNGSSILDAAGMGVGVSELYGRVERSKIQGGLSKNGDYFGRAIGGMALEKAYGVNVDEHLGKLMDTEMVEVSIKMLNKLASIESKSGVTANNTTLANQKLSEFSSISKQQLSHSFTIDSKIAMNDMMAFQKLMPGNGNAEGIAALSGLYTGDITREHGGGLDIIGNMAAQETAKQTGLVNGRNMGDMWGIVKRIKSGRVSASQLQVYKELYSKYARKLMPSTMPNATLWRDILMPGLSGRVDNETGENMNDVYFRKGIDFSDVTESDQFSIDKAKTKAKEMTSPKANAEALAEMIGAIKAMEEYMEDAKKNLASIATGVGVLSSSMIKNSGYLPVKIKH